jgi:hypothetical protein
MKWFKHDSNAHTDDKIQKVLMKYGADGYALYWYCIELIASRVSPDNITFELRHDAEILGYHLKIDTLKVEEIMKYMINLGLFDVNNDKIVCYKLAKRLDNTLSQNPQIKETLSNFKKLEADKIRSDKIRSEDLNIPSKPQSVLPFTANRVMDIWNEVFNNTYARNKKFLSDTTKRRINTLTKNEFKTEDDWELFFRTLTKSDFLMGKIETRGRKPFQLSLEWAIKEANIIKIMEGAYHG